MATVPSSSAESPTATSTSSQEKQEQASSAAPPQRRQPTSRDAYVLALKRIDPMKDLQELPKKPCARQSLLLGIGGGVAVGAIRFLSNRRPLSSSNWAVATFAVLSLTSWETCRRSHAKEQTRIRQLMAEYRNKAKSLPGDDDNKIRHGPVGGVLMGQRGKEMLQDKQGNDGGGSSGSTEQEPRRLV